jgi:hypothetical protein
LDWISTKKVTDAAAKMIWGIVSLMMPAGVSVPSWYQIKRTLVKAEDGLVERIDVCPQDCIAYWDSAHLPEVYQHAHRTKCPVCDEPRYVTDPADGRTRARKVPPPHPLSTFPSYMSELRILWTF